MRPLVGSIRRLIILMVVVLPQPDGPTSTQISPSGDLEGEVVDRDLAVVVALGHLLQPDHRQER